MYLGHKTERAVSKISPTQINVAGDAFFGERKAQASMTDTVPKAMIPNLAINPVGKMAAPNPRTAATSKKPRIRPTVAAALV
jgi:hypothetical protein